jgi:hypothetical protein
MDMAGILSGRGCGSVIIQLIELVAQRESACPGIIAADFRFPVYQGLV